VPHLKLCCRFFNFLPGKIGNHLILQDQQALDPAQQAATTQPSHSTFSQEAAHLTHVMRAAC
jgi:hypothetical protein